MILCPGPGEILPPVETAEQWQRGCELSVADPDRYFWSVYFPKFGWCTPKYQGPEPSLSIIRSWSPDVVAYYAMTYDARQQVRYAAPGIRKPIADHFAPGELEDCLFAALGIQGEVQRG
jgi:hypothetical protein